MRNLQLLCDVIGLFCKKLLSVLAKLVRELPKKVEGLTQLYYHFPNLACGQGVEMQDICVLWHPSIAYMTRRSYRQTRLLFVS